VALQVGSADNICSVPQLYFEDATEFAVSYEALTDEELILRDHLALDRTRLANERTLLAYIRTALMLLVAGGSAVRFVGDSHDVIVTGWLFIFLGFGVGGIGVWRYLKVRQRIVDRNVQSKLR
jgi:putative membrane protein